MLSATIGAYVAIMLHAYGCMLRLHVLIGKLQKISSVLAEKTLRHCCISSICLYGPWPSCH